MGKTFRIAGLLLLIGALGYALILSSGRPFNSERWKAWEETEAECCLRWEMVQSLKRQHKLVAMHRSEIIELLGEPNSESFSELYYYLGMAKHGIDTGSLRLFLDHSGFVKYYEISRG